MATLINTSGSGYINPANASGRSEQIGNKADIYIGDSGVSRPLIGIIQFNDSINNALNLTASDWEDLEFSSVILTLQKASFQPASTSVLTSGYSIGAGIEELSDRAEKIYHVSDEVYLLPDISVIPFSQTGLTCTENSYIYTFDLTSFFNSFSNGKDFLPSSTSWRLFIQAPNNYTTKRGFARKETYNTTLTIEGTNASNAYVRTASGWVKATPYVRTSSGWVKATSYIKANGGWEK